MTRIRFDGRGRHDPLSAQCGLDSRADHFPPYLAAARQSGLTVSTSIHRPRRSDGVAQVDGVAVRARLQDARLYLCTDARGARGDLAEFADAALAGGVDIIQLRDKTLEARPELAALEVLADACRHHGALLAVNDRADVALAAGAHVLHLGQDDLPVSWARRIVGDEVVIGRSTHDPAQAGAAASEPGVDYFCAGPCWPTPTKPGRPAAGLELIRSTAAAQPARPWFAIGGIENARRLEDVLRAGARRVVVVRAITEATDPEGMTAAFAQRLRSAR
jgi:thiamine-phosphate pyrophosphorylase